MPEDKLAILLMRMRELARPDGRVNVDTALAKLLDHWATWQEEKETSLRKLFRSGDVDLNHALTYDEFFSIMHDKTMINVLGFAINDKQITTLYRQASHLSAPLDTIDADSFCSVLLHAEEVLHVTSPDDNNEVHKWHPPGDTPEAASSVPKIDGTQMIKLLDQTWSTYASKIPEAVEELVSLAVAELDIMQKKSSGKRERSRTVTDRDEPAEAAS